MIYVFDASFIGTLIIPDEKNTITDKFYAKIKNDDKKYVPNLFWYEISNIFFNLIRRKRYTFEEIINFYPRIAAFNLNNDNETGIVYSNKIFSLCNDYNISSYDAAYLELAERKKAVLCTLDNVLQEAAKKYGITVIK